MSKMPSSMLVCVRDHSATIRITGRANFTASVNFKLLVNELKASGFDRFMLDLSDCVTMDSTFLGVLAGLALKLNDGRNGLHSVTLELLNPNQRVTDLLENLGVSHLFPTVYGTAPSDETFEPSLQTGTSPTRQEISETCLEAHQTLMAVNPANIPKFKDVAQFLAEDLKKLKEKAGAADS